MVCVTGPAEINGELDDYQHSSSAGSGQEESLKKLDQHPEPNSRLCSCVSRERTRRIRYSGDSKYLPHLEIYRLGASNI